MTQDEHWKESVVASWEKQADNPDPQLRAIALSNRQLREEDELRIFGRLRAVLSRTRSLAIRLRLWWAGASATPTPSTAHQASDEQLIDDGVLIAVAPGIRRKLTQLMSSGIAPRTALDQVFVDIFGECKGAEDRMRFMMYVVPLARRLALQKADKEFLVLAGVSVAVAEEVYAWIDACDPGVARMLDLHYFAGVSIREIARAFELHPSVVVRELRCVKEWAHLKLQ